MYTEQQQPNSERYESPQSSTLMTKLLSTFEMNYEPNISQIKSSTCEIGQDSNRLFSEDDQKVLYLKYIELRQKDRFKKIYESKSNKKLKREEREKNIAEKQKYIEERVVELVKQSKNNYETMQKNRSERQILNEKSKELLRDTANLRKRQEEIDYFIEKTKQRERTERIKKLSIQNVFAFSKKYHVANRQPQIKDKEVSCQNPLQLYQKNQKKMKKHEKQVMKKSSELEIKMKDFNENQLKANEKQAELLQKQQKLKEREEKLIKEQSILDKKMNNLKLLKEAYKKKKQQAQVKINQRDKELTIKQNQLKKQKIISFKVSVDLKIRQKLILDRQEKSGKSLTQFAKKFMDLRYLLQNDEVDISELLNVSLKENISLIKFFGNSTQGPIICAICYEEYRENQIIVKMNCNHLFHANCITLWLKGHERCPIPFPHQPST